MCDLSTEVCTGVKTCREGVMPHGLVYTNTPKECFIEICVRKLSKYWIPVTV